VAQFARQLGVTKQAVRVAIEDARVTAVGYDKRNHRLVITDPELARQQWETQTQPRSPNVAANGHATPAPKSLAAATLRERMARAKVLELEYRRKRRQLVPLKDYELGEAARVVAARTKLLGIPSRAKQRLPHLTPGDLEVLDELVRESLEELVTEQTAAVLAS